MMSMTTWQELSQPTRASSIVMGRQDRLSVLLRLIAMELYKMRRRTLTKVLFSLLFGLFIALYLGFGIGDWSVAVQPITQFVPPSCVIATKTVDCVNHQPTLVDMLHYKQDQVLLTGQTLLLPSSLSIILYLLANILFVIIVALIGTMVGGEYSLGTIRQLFTRGPSRLQFLWSKIGASIIVVLLTFLILPLFIVLLGYLFFSFTGVTPDLHFLTAGWIGHAFVLLVIGMASWFIYAMMALFFGTMGRSSTAGIVGPIIWIFIEDVLGPVILNLGQGMHGTAGNIVRAIPNFFVSNTITALIKNQVHFLTGDASSAISSYQALGMFIVYLVVFVGLASWITVRRDVTN